MANITITYESLKAQLATILSPGAGGAGSTEVYVPPQGVEIIVPPLPPRLIPYMEDLTLTSNITAGPKINLSELLHINNSKNTYSGGGQVIINADRIILNTRIDYLMLFGGKGVAVSSQGNVNIDADEAVTLHGADGVFIGVPGSPGPEKKPKVKQKKTPANRGEPTVDEDYEPMILGLKLANFLNDLLVALDSATISGTIGNCRFREDTSREFQQLACRIPEMLSTYAYVDGISHEATLKPVPPNVTVDEITVVDNVLRGRTTGTDSSIRNTIDVQPAPVTNPFASLPGYYTPSEIQINTNKI